MESVGEFFRQVRETKGLTVDEVSSKTRIRSDFVKALEDGNFSKLPDQVFARGFVRSYARSLGLDEEDAIQRFAKSAGTFYEKQDERERLKVRQAEEERKRQSNRKAVAVVIGIAVLTLIFLLSREQSTVLKRAEPEPASPKQSTQTVKDAPVAAATKEAEPAAESTKSNETVAAAPISVSNARRAEPTPPPVAASKPETETVSAVSVGTDGPLSGISLEAAGAMADTQLVLDLEATELSWVVVQIDNGSPQESLLRPGEKAQWKGRDQFVLTLGNAGGVKAELNGKPQKPFGPSGKVAREILLKR
ncbi:MAG: helix-turn-helix domain-containing protein [Nitrospira sp.]|nr:helix-turn-helix domain-containing protein [Nitrospira sp.]MBH0182506.1 helix-turn-helix domain-containing protein [Nitrospira sp.]